MAQHLAGLGPVGLQEGLTQRSCRHALLGFGDIGQGIAHPMHAAALPGSAKHLADPRFEPFMSVGDDSLTLRNPRRVRLSENPTRRSRPLTGEHSWHRTYNMDI